MPGIFFLVSGPWDAIAEEFEQHRDLVWIQMEEDYMSLTYKVSAFLKIVDDVATEYNIQYSHVLKTDDDSYVALDRLRTHFNFLEAKGVSTKYWGNCRKNVNKEVDRDPNKKWSLGFHEYPEAIFPVNAVGAGYVMSRDFVHCAAGSGHIAKTRFLKLEDVFVGMLAERCHISPTCERELVHDLRLGTDKERFDVSMSRGALDEKKLTPADMAGRIIQHRINSGYIQIVAGATKIPAFWAHPQYGGPFPGLVLLHDVRRGTSKRETFEMRQIHDEFPFL